MKEVEIFENSPEKENAQQKKEERELRDHIERLDKILDCHNVIRDTGRVEVINEK